MIPVILKGETSKPIQLTLREGYVYSGCVLAVCFRGVMKTFTDLVAGGTVELLYTAEETSTFPLGTGKVGLSIQNSAGDICFMPWAKIKVTDSPDEVHDAQITIDPATLNVSDATSKDSLGAVKSKLNAVLAFLRGLSSLAVLALPLYALSDVAPLYSAFEDIPGDEQVVTNVVPYVEAKVTAATNAIPAPDYSTGNAQLVATIEATAPAPGNYAAVSNRAMSALQSHQSLAPSTNYTDAALGAFAATGAVARATVYGTSSCFTDATGCVWSVTGAYADWHISTNGIPFKTIVCDNEVWADGDTSMSYTGENWFFTGPWIDGAYDGPEDILSFAVETDIYSYGDFVEAEVEFARDAVYVYQTNLVGRVALTNDIPDIHAWAKAANKPTYTASEVGATDGEAVTNIVRGMSLGGIWDQKLGVWWTPIMENGALRYIATTNVNLSAEGNQ